MRNEPPQAGQSGDSLVDPFECGIYNLRAVGSYGIALDPCQCKYTANSVSVGCTPYAYQSGFNYNVWYFFALTVDPNGNVITYAYKPGAATPTTASYSIGQSIYVPSSTAYIGSYGGTPSYDLNGSLADIQIYNTSLDANQVQALYIEGIGGVPVNLQHIVGWWPLNGDLNDYSGNGNAGMPTANIIFTGSWTTGYTTP